MDLTKGSDGESDFQKEVEYFGRLMAQHPGLSVDYLGRPLMLRYVGIPVNPTIVYRVKAVLQDTQRQSRPGDCPIDHNRCAQSWASSDG